MKEVESNRKIHSNFCQIATIQLLFEYFIWLYFLQFPAQIRHQPMEVLLLNILRHHHQMESFLRPQSYALHVTLGSLCPIPSFHVLM